MGHWPECLLTRFAAAGAPFLEGMLSAGCMASAARSSLFDPHSDGFQNGGSQEGEVIRIDGAEPSGAVVRLEPGSHVAMSGEDGRFQLNGIASEAYTHYVSNEGFGADSSTVEVQPGAVAQIIGQADALSINSDESVRAGHIGCHAPQTNPHVHDARARADGPDGGFGLDSVWMEISQANYTGGLDVTTTSLRFRASVAASDLSQPAMHTLIRKSVLLHARDRAGFVVSMPVAIVRAVDPTPVAVSQHLTTGGDVEFTWQAVSLPYPFTYRAGVYRMLGANVPEIYCSQSNLNEKTSSFRFENAPPGDYFWTIFVVDEFGNRSQSAPAGFSVS